MKNNTKTEGGAPYETPSCDLITVVVENSILTTSGLLDDLENNDIFNEDF